MKVHTLADAESRRAFQKRVLAELDVAEALFRRTGPSRAGPHSVGVEQEVQLIGRDARPAQLSESIAASLSAPEFKQEFSRFTFEVALPPQRSGADLLVQTESKLREHLQRIEREAARHDVRVMMCGILPSLQTADIGLASLTGSPRYQMLRDMRHEAKSGGFEYQIRGIDELVLPHSGDLLLDGVFTSLQLHWQLRPETAADDYNWSQLIAAPCVAAACCSPLFLGKRLWHETRITLFQQSSDLRSHGAGASRDHRARATLGHGWIDDILDVWKEELADYVPLLGIDAGEEIEDPDSGRAPILNHLQFFNGTVYRWNRLRYGVDGDGAASLRVESRALPAGLTLRDELANAALWWGLMAAGRERAGALGTMPFSRVRESFRRAARDGMESQIHWADGALYPTDRLLLDMLIPLAADGLRTMGVADAEAWLAPVEARASSKQTASRWMLDTFESLLGTHDADAASVHLTEAIADLASSDRPVSEWPARRAPPKQPPRPVPIRCSDPIELALHRLRWQGADELSVHTMAGEVIAIRAEPLEQARKHGLASVADAIALHRGGLAPEGADEPSIDAFGWRVPVRRILYRKAAAEAGPLVVILAGLHGNEWNGVASAACFGETADPARGEIVALLGNLPALQRGARFLDHDLNRTFAEGGWPEATPEGREARLLWSALEQLSTGADGRERWLIDLHGTSGHTPPYLSALCDRFAWPILDDLPVPRAIGFENVIRNTLVEYAARRGWKAATFELGALSAPVSVTNGVAILQLIADRLGMVPLAPDERLRITDGLTAQSPTQGSYEFVYRHAIEPEDQFEMLPGFVSFQPLRQGEILGSDRNGPVCAPCDGLILMPLYQPQGESGFYVVAPPGRKAA